jgi:hypothetical protein
MTLKKKIDCISCSDCDMPYCDIKCTRLSEYELSVLEKIADDFAIEFAVWLVERVAGEKGLILQRSVLEQFKKEKKL